jgi:hypothetical protein
MNSTSVQMTPDNKYEFATHVIKVKRSGQVTEVRSLWELEGKGLKLFIETFMLAKLESFQVELSVRLQNFHQL